VTSTSFRLFYLTIGDTYDFFVTAVNAGGAGPHSNVATAAPVVPDEGASASVASNWIFKSKSAVRSAVQLTDMLITVTGQRTGTTITLTFAWSTDEPGVNPVLYDGVYGFGLVDCNTGVVTGLEHLVYTFGTSKGGESRSEPVKVNPYHYYSAFAWGNGDMQAVVINNGIPAYYQSAFGVNAPGAIESASGIPIVPTKTGTGCPYGI
jgi:hypothetical protein